MNRGEILVKIKYGATVQLRHKMLWNKTMLCTLICKLPYLQSTLVPIILFEPCKNLMQVENKYY